MYYVDGTPSFLFFFNMSLESSSFSSIGVVVPTEPFNPNYESKLDYLIRNASIRVVGNWNIFNQPTVRWIENHSEDEIYNVLEDEVIKPVEERAMEYPDINETNFKNALQTIFETIDTQGNIIFQLTSSGPNPYLEEIRRLSLPLSNWGSTADAAREHMRRLQYMYVQEALKMRREVVIFYLILYGPVTIVDDSKYNHDSMIQWISTSYENIGQVFSFVASDMSKLMKEERKAYFERMSERLTMAMEAIGDSSSSQSDVLRQLESDENPYIETLGDIDDYTSRTEHADSARTFMLKLQRRYSSESLSLTKKITTLEMIVKRYLNRIN
jgi:hypothetical protein